MPRATLSMLELSARDPERLARFFEDVFGWAAIEMPWDGPRYLRLLPPDGEATGVGLLSQGDGGAALVEGITLVVRVEDEPIAAVLARVERAGGAVALAPRAVGESGSYARVHDPEGNSIGIWSAAR